MEPPKLDSEAFDFLNYYGDSPARLVLTYAEALLNAAEKQGIAQQVQEELDSLIDDVFRRSPELEATTATRRLHRNVVDRLILTAFEGRASSLFVDFLRILNNRDRNFLIRPIAAAYRFLREQRHNLVRVQVYTAVALDEKFCSELEKTLAKVLNAEPVVYVREQPELLGGMVIRVGTKVIDSSVRTRLDTIRNQLLLRGSHEIQSGRNRLSH